MSLVLRKKPGSDNKDSNSTYFDADQDLTQQLIEQYYEYLKYTKNNKHKKGGNECINEEQAEGGEEHDLEDDDSDVSDEIEPVTLLSKLKSIFYRTFLGDRYQRNLLIAKLQSQRKHSMSYEEWKFATMRLDSLTNKYKWKRKLESSLYDYDLVLDITRRLKIARMNGNYHQLLYLIRTNWVRNLANMGNVNLYRHSYIGTKSLIDEYMTESKLSLQALLDCGEIDDEYLMGILQQTRRNIGRTALVLSGGGTFGLFHIGVLATLFELDLLPRVISGSSAGAIVASILSIHHKEEIPALLQRILSTDFNIFKDDKQKSESENFLIKMSRFFKNGTWFNNKHLVNTMISFLGDLTFREAYNRTGKILNITVSPASLFEQPRLLNNLTAPNVLIWSAVCASCSLPGIFPSSPLYEKDPKTGEKREWNGSSSVKFVDGSVDNDLPISRLSEMFNVDHIIACQVNIHVVPFLKLSVSCVGGEIEDEFSAKLRQQLGRIYNFMSGEMIHYLELGSEIGIAKNTLTKLRSVLSQQYSGDVTILPDMGMLFRINELLSNPTKEFLLREITNGARATWPKISIIENHCGQEFALDKAISFLKGRIIVSSTLRNPLQFSDMPIGLIKNKDFPITPDATRRQIELNLDTNTVTDNANKYINENNVLDDNLMETESTKSLLLLSENNKASQESNKNRKRQSIVSTWNSQIKSPTLRQHLRRKSESGAYVGNSYYNHHHFNNGNIGSGSSSHIHGFKPYTTGITSPPSRLRRMSSNYRIRNSVSPNMFGSKNSTGNIYFPMERRTWNVYSDTTPTAKPSDQQPLLVTGYNVLTSPRPAIAQRRLKSHTFDQSMSASTATQHSNNDSIETLQPAQSNGASTSQTEMETQMQSQSPSTSSLSHSASVNPFYPGEPGSANRRTRYHSFAGHSGVNTDLRDPFRRNSTDHEGGYLYNAEDFYDGLRSQHDSRSSSNILNPLSDYTSQDNAALDDTLEEVDAQSASPESNSPGLSSPRLSSSSGSSSEGHASSASTPLLAHQDSRSTGSAVDPVDSQPHLQ